MKRKQRRAGSSRKKGRLNSVKKILKDKEVQDLIFRIIREIIKSLK